VRQCIRRLVPLAGVGLLLVGCTPPPPAAVPLSQARIDARTTLLQAAESPDPIVRARAVEALSQTLGAEVAGVYVQALSDPAPPVQFAAALAAGRLKYEPARDRLVEMAEAQGPDKRVYSGVIYALYRLGNEQYMKDLIRLMLHSRPEVRGNAVMVLGMLGLPSAVTPLEQGLLPDETDKTVILQVVEALVMLGEDRYARKLEGYAKEPFLDDRLMAVKAMGRIAAPTYVPVLRELLHKARPWVQVAAAGALARMGQADGAAFRLTLRALARPRPLLEAAADYPQQVTAEHVLELRRLAALALGWMGRREAVRYLHPHLRAEDGSLRVAAALSTLRLLPEMQTPAPPAPGPTPDEPADADAEPDQPKPPPRPKLQTAGGKD